MRDADTPGGAVPICQNLRTHVTYYLFAPQGSGEAESFTPLKRRTTSYIYSLVRTDALHLEWEIHPSTVVISCAADRRSAGHADLTGGAGRIS